jgi:hypothetical protein
VNKNLFFADLDTGVAMQVSDNAVPVGYNSVNNDSLLFIHQTQQGTFQLINANDNAVLADNIAPGATSLCMTSPPTDRAPICDDSVAFNPYTTQFVYGASYADGSHKLFTDNWQIPGKTQITIPNDLSKVQLIGWDRIVPK